MKKVQIAIGIFLLFGFLILFINYMANEKMIENYENGEYKENRLSVLGFTEPYIAPYNKGNLFYKKGEYEMAVEEYEKALHLNPTHDRECKIRINLALAMIAPIDPEEITEKDVDDILEILNEARNTLCENDCASFDGVGHSEDAQKLKEDIDRFEEELKNQTDSPSEPDDKQDDNEKENEKMENEQEKREQLQDIQRQGTNERNSQLVNGEYINNFEFYDGATW